MTRKPFEHSNRQAKGVTRRTFTAGAAAATALVASPAILRAQGGALKVGVLLPRSGAQAGIGQDCFRGVELTNPILKGICVNPRLLWQFILQNHPCKSVPLVAILW